MAKNHKLSKENLDDLALKYGQEFISENYPDDAFLSRDDINEIFSNMSPFELIEMGIHAGTAYAPGSVDFSIFNINADHFVLDGYGRLCAVPEPDGYLISLVEDYKDDFLQWLDENGYL